MFSKDVLDSKFPKSTSSSINLFQNFFSSNSSEHNIKYLKSEKSIQSSNWCKVFENVGFSTTIFQFHYRAICHFRSILTKHQKFSKSLAHIVRKTKVWKYVVEIKNNYNQAFKQILKNDICQYFGQEQSMNFSALTGNHNNVL